MSTTLARNKEGVPIWDGEAGTFNDFEEASLMWEQSVAYQKRYLCGPRIQAELTGAARRLVAGKSPTWLSHSGGVRELMRHLRSCLGKPQIAELSEFLNRYFKNSRRKPSESINEYVTRKCEIYLRAQQALRRIAPHQKKASLAGSTTSSASGPPRWTWRSSRWPGSNVTENAESEEPGEVQSAAPTAEAETEEEAPRSEGDNWSWSSWNGYGGWQPGGWGRYGRGNPSWSWTPWQWDPDDQRSLDEMEEMPELLPDYVQGWYLLQDSGLSTNEKNIIQTALQGDFSLQKVAQELRNQWSGGDLARRDHGLRQGSYIGEYHEEVEDEDDSEVLERDNIEDLLDEEGLDWSGKGGSDSFGPTSGSEEDSTRSKGEAAFCETLAPVLQGLVPTRYLGIFDSSS